MREDWVVCLLGDVVTIQTGKYDANHAKANGKYRFYTCAFEYFMCDTNRFSGKSIILPGNGANVGEVFYYEGEFDAYQRTYVLNDLKLNAKYIFYHLKGFWKSKNLDKQFGTATNYIRMGNFTDYSLSFPSLPEQRAIVAKIEELFSDLDKGIADLKKAQDQLKVYRQAVLSSSFSKEIYVEISKLVINLRQGWSPKCINQNSTDEEQWAVIKTSAIQAGRFIELENKILPDNLEPREQHEIKKGDILITRAGPRVRVGVCCLVRNTRPKLINCDKVYRLEIDTTQVDAEYFEYVMNSPEVLREIEVMKTGTSDSGLNLTQKAFLKLKIPYVDLEKQHQIVQEIESRLSVCDKVEESITESLEKAKALRQSILKKAFEGTLLSEEEIAACKAAPDYEPASVLLEKIKAESVRQAQDKKKKKQL